MSDVPLVFRGEQALLTIEAFFAGCPLFLELTAKQQRVCCKYFTMCTLVHEEAAFEQAEVSGPSAPDISVQCTQCCAICAHRCVSLCH